MVVPSATWHLLDEHRVPLSLAVGGRRHGRAGRDLGLRQQSCDGLKTHVERVMLGPIAVVIVSVLVFWVSEAPVSLIGILVFNAAALPTWLVLHLL